MKAQRMAARELRPGDRWAMTNPSGKIVKSWRVVRALRSGERVTLVWTPAICGVDRETIDGDRSVLVLRRVG